MSDRRVVNQWLWHHHRGRHGQSLQTGGTSDCHSGGVDVSAMRLRAPADDAVPAIGAWRSCQRPDHGGFCPRGPRPAAVGRARGSCLSMSDSAGLTGEQVACQTPADMTASVSGSAVCPDRAPAAGLSDTARVCQTGVRHRAEVVRPVSETRVFVRADRARFEGEGWSGAAAGGQTAARWRSNDGDMPNPRDGVAVS